MATSIRRFGTWVARVVALAVALLVSAYLVVSAQRQASRAAPAVSVDPAAVKQESSAFAAPEPLVLVEPPAAFLFSSKSMRIGLEATPNADTQAEGAVAEADAAPKTP
jgi:hypothetical protein